MLKSDTAVYEIYRRILNAAQTVPGDLYEFDIVQMLVNGPRLIKHRRRKIYPNDRCKPTRERPSQAPDTTAEVQSQT